jgi:hypothetical protein
LSRLTNSNEQRFESLRLALEARLAAMQGDNALKLEEMRRRSMKSCTRRSSSGWANRSSWSAIASSRCIAGLARCRRWPPASAT